MINFIKKLFCKHTFVLVRDIYGDEINYTNNRSIWKCIHCGKIEYREKLHIYYEKLK